VESISYVAVAWGANSLFLLLCWVGVHCGIYKSSYNLSTISYLNLSPTPTLPHSWNSFNKYHFCIYIHVCTILALHSPSYPLSPPPSPSYNSQDLFCPPVIQFCRGQKKKREKKWQFCLFKIKVGTQEVSLWIFPYIYVL
jgi:hypothetical protein